MVHSPYNAGETHATLRLTSSATLAGHLPTRCDMLDGSIGGQRKRSHARKRRPMTIREGFTKAGNCILQGVPLCSALFMGRVSQPIPFKLNEQTSSIVSRIMAMKRPTEELHTGVTSSDEACCIFVRREIAEMSITLLR